MLILAVGDLHGQAWWVGEAVDRARPNLLLCTGDWGDPGQISEEEYHALLARVPVLSVFGNHDDRPLLRRLRNRDGQAVLLEQGEVRSVSGVTVAGLSGIWAKTKLGARLGARWEWARAQNPALSLAEWLAGRELPPYVTDEEADAVTARLAGAPVDVLVTHGCPVGMADLTPRGGRGGQACFRRLLDRVCPVVALCGHLHRLQRQDLPDGRLVLNVGLGAERQGWLIRREGAGATWAAAPLPG